ncbi:MAG: spore maturation protein [Candidatus Margulisiibacteriota bacterium]|nr:MAG: spore maturation protein [Candidatus Margulisbacteria bacterium GWD2_39_127]OGI03407.1 MAG: spore maturation protein [Candidatus Margulisbacteria bacterium GWF2_38_17]OGI06558.1 MAG: spore maturation protein [Candidatus Margulisbacteria bacterium GWE2_39_32]PZM81920.1 MAG: spore maturation protein [Candidatus Margulisiibacteriota bacterium]HAR64093.1 spore maturation protein [Candidatus Margulisiibacteriota bacterium]
MIHYISYISLLIIPGFILFTLLYGTFKKVSVYDSFVAGAKEGPGIILNIFPYLLTIFVAIKGFQASGAFEYIRDIFYSVFSFMHIPIEVISMGIIKPLSGSASTALFTDIVKTTGPDSMATTMTAVIMGSAETTFYVLSVYLGAVSIKKTRYLVPVCLTADLIGIVVAVIIVKVLF